MIGRKGLRGANIVRRQARMVGQDLLDAVAGGEAAQDVLHGDARAADDGLAHHHLRVALNARMGHRADRLLSLIHI